MVERIKKIMIVFLEEILCIQNLPTFLINAKITYHEAKEFALNEVDKKSKEWETDLILIERFTIQKEFGWIFIYNSKIYYLTKNEEFALVGNAPFIVDNKNGKIVYLGTADPIQYYTKLYREHRNNLNNFKSNFLILPTPINVGC